jgi:hypothetical protein
MEPSDNCTWPLQHNNLLSIVHSRHDSCTSARDVIQQFSRLVGEAAPATRVCITWMWVWACGHECMARWAGCFRLMPLTMPRQSNSVPTLPAPCATCFRVLYCTVLGTHRRSTTGKTPGNNSHRPPGETPLAAAVDDWTIRRYQHLAAKLKY